MATLTENVNVFDKKFYEALSSRAAKYGRENATGSLIARIPMAPGISFNQNQYKKPIYEESEGVIGGKPGLLQDQILTAKDYKVYNMENVSIHVYWDQDDMMEQGAFLVQQKQEQLDEWARQANMSIMKGVYTKGFSQPAVAATGSAGQGSKLNDGILSQATTVADLQGADSILDAAGDVYKSLVKMITSIPFRYANGKEIILGMTPHFYDMANSATFTNASGLTEWEQFFRIHVAGQSPYKVSENIIFSDDLFKSGTDITNTNDRLFAMVAEPGIVERAYSRGFGLMGEDTNHIGGITQTWTTKLEGCVHRPEGVLFSEQIAWA